MSQISATKLQHRFVRGSTDLSGSQAHLSCLTSDSSKCKKKIQNSILERKTEKNLYVNIRQEASARELLLYSKDAFSFLSIRISFAPCLQFHSLLFCVCIHYFICSQSSFISIECPLLMKSLMNRFFIITSLFLSL